jgi:hypothetical protein
MNSHSFSLKPFQSSGTLPFLEISGNIGRHSNTLTISYTLHGLLSEVIIPAPADVPARKNALWEETCFEFFLGTKNSDRYWEFNLSPAEHWNVYCFKSYRQGMQEELAFESLPVSVQRKPDVLQLSLNLDLGKINLIDKTLEVAISAVINHVNGKITYWALAHPGPQADFHLKDSFIIEL